MRKKGLDILRAIAVILVLFRHSDLENNIFRHFGWLGVDLFFVLSGFLISNILFVEYKKYGNINIKRFLIRRGFKIFLPFYFFLFCTLLFTYFFNSTTYRWTETISEVFYLQSYVPNIWIHTWSLAVEEHFYLLFSITVLLLSRKNLLRKKGFIVSSLILLLIISFLLRFNVSYPHRADSSFGFVKTHLRSDGIILGVLLSYLHNFTQSLNQFLKRKWILFLLSSLLIAPGFYFKGGGYFMNTVGLTTVNLGFSLLVLLSLDLEKYLNSGVLKYLKIPVNILCLIGINSYSIYLWHINIKKIIYNNTSYDLHLMAAAYILLSILSGILMSYLIEKPSLRLRDYTFRKITL
jgi:peptidoglycan/LPS O-acetylase OafA/YrhL